MPTPKLPDDVVQAALDALEQYGGSVKDAADALGLNQQTLRDRALKALARGLVPASRRPAAASRPAAARDLDVPKLPSELRPVEDLLAERKRKFAHHKAAKEARRLIRIPVNVDGPIAISHFGDPHIDDDGCDIEMLERDVEVVKRTPAMFAMNCGDTANNWIGRLARLWEQQSTSGPEAWQLVEWFIRSLDWLVILGGNHGAWSGTGDPVNWIVDHGKTIFDNFGARVALEFPNNREIRINARHDFRGRSMWNPTHGALKAAKMGWRDHVLTCGHTHESGISIEKDPATGLVSHIYRIASYKTYDRYAHEEGLPDQNVFCNVVTVIDPSRPDNDANVVRAFYNETEHAAEYLTWIRGRRSRIAVPAA